MIETKKIYYRPKEIEQLLGIKQSTLSKQRQGKFGLPYVVVGRNPKSNRGGIILYKVSDIFFSEHLVGVFQKFFVINILLQSHHLNNYMHVY